MAALNRSRTEPTSTHTIPVVLRCNNGLATTESVGGHLDFFYAGYDTSHTSGGRLHYQAAQASERWPRLGTMNA